jgi:hypothetical protein
VSTASKDNLSSRDPEGRHIIIVNGSGVSIYIKPTRTEILRVETTDYTNTGYYTMPKDTRLYLISTSKY